MNTRPIFHWLLILSLLLPTLLRAQSPAVVPWAWVERAIGPAENAGFGVATDAVGNVYVTGYFRQALTIGTTTLRTDSTDAFLAKYTAQGTAVWVRQLGSTGQGVGYEVVADAAGNCYVAGVFRGTVALGTAALTSQSDGDEFIINMTRRVRLCGDSASAIWLPATVTRFFPEPISPSVLI